MKGHLKKRLLFTFIFVVQIFIAPQILAEDVKTVVIPQQIIKCTRGTVIIPTQEIYADEDIYNEYIDFYVTDVPKVFEPMYLMSNGKEISYIGTDWDDTVGGSFTYFNYLNLRDIKISAKLNPVTSPSDMVDLLNGFVDSGAQLNDNGEVVLLKDIVYHYDYNNPDNPRAGQDPTEDQTWLIQTDLTLIGNGHHIEGRYGSGFDIEVENSTFTVDNVIRDCKLKVTNSTIYCKNYNQFNNVWTKGNVLFKGIYDEGELVGLDFPCEHGNTFLELDVLDQYISNSTISIEDLAVEFGGIHVPASTVVNIKRCWFETCGGHYVSSDSTEFRNIKIFGGTVNIEESFLQSCDIIGRPIYPFAEVESGSLNIESSNILDDILVKGKKANVEINSGQFHALTIQEGNVKVNSGHFTNGITIDGGSLEVNNGYFPGGITMDGGSLEVNNGYFPGGITMDGGSLEVNGGKVALLDVNDEKCDITLNQGLFGGIKIPSEVNKSIWDMLGHGAGYYDRDGTYIPYRLGHIEGNDETVGSIIQSTTYPVSFVLSNYSAVPTPAFTAAQDANVGPNGTDIKVRSNGDLEIWTPKGMAWLAFMCSDTHERVQTGREYYEQGKDWYLMDDLDMDGYGDLWPELNIIGRTFFGQGHRIYNLDVLRPDACFIKLVTQGAVVRDMIVEGSVSNLKDEGGRMPDSYGNINYNVSGFARQNKGLIVNCAYKGTVWNAALGCVNIGGFVGTNHGRIENCYVAPCGQTIGGVRYAEEHFEFENEYPCAPPETEGYYVGGFAISNGYLATTPEDGFIENCYFGGRVSYDSMTSENENINIECVTGVLNIKGALCEHLYILDEDISAETLNKNALEHTPEMYEGTSYPYVEWAAWAESDDKQCGRPYFVWEKHLDDTPTGIDGVEAQGGFKAWSEDGMLCFCTDGSADVLVYSAGGRLCVRHSAQTGTERVALPKGIYIVKCGGTSKKVIL